MMFASLRSRLWLTYALLILAVLAIVGTGMVLALIRNPLIYRQATLTLRVTEAALKLRMENQPKAALDKLENLVQRQAENDNVRILLLDANAAVLVDTGLGSAQPALRLPQMLKPNNDNLAQVSMLRDVKLRVWLYALSPIENNRYLMVAVPRPRIPLRTLFSDQLFLPLTEAGAVALLISILLALAMARWISAPLGRIRTAAGKVAAGQVHPIPLEGPAEVKDLARSFNEMTHRVQVGQQSQRDFVANVSHELKTPLTSIQGFAQAILDGAASSPEAVRIAVDVIQKEAERMYRLVMDLLVLARLDAGTADLQVEPIDLSELINAVTSKFVPQASQGQVTLTTEASNLPIIQGDGDRLVQVFSNLIDNAIKYTPAGGSVKIEGKQAGSFVEINVKDTGIGIAPDDQERIFERFYQADKSRRGGTGRGVGLGLAIARQIVQAEGGTLTAHSQPGQGSQFIVKLPIA
jgi:two-component system OmpR family sensor kinase